MRNRELDQKGNRVKMRMPQFSERVLRPWVQIANNCMPTKTNVHGTSNRQIRLAHLTFTTSFYFVLLLFCASVASFDFSSSSFFVSYCSKIVLLHSTFSPQTEQCGKCDMHSKMLTIIWQTFCIVYGYVVTDQ